MKNLAGLNKWVALAVAGFGLVSGGAMATPITGTGLQSALTTLPQAAIINVNTDQLGADAFWVVGGTGLISNVLMFELTTPNAAYNSFGIFDRNVPGSKLEIFNGANVAGDTETAKKLLLSANNCFGFGMSVTAAKCSDATTAAANGNVLFSTPAFGFYLSTKDAQGNVLQTLYSYDSYNTDLADHMVAFQGGAGKGSLNGAPWLANEFVLAWEDQAAATGDFDDFVVLVESVTPVSEPATLSLLGMGLLAFGLRNRKKLRA